MLGEKIAEFSGKNTGRRVIPNGTHGLTMEISMEQHGKLLGVDSIDYGTYEAVMCDGHLEGTGQGITMTPDGESATWTATGIGVFTGKGQAVAWRGSIVYHSKSKKLARVNGACFVFEHDIDEHGTSSKSRIFEWK